MELLTCRSHCKKSESVQSGVSSWVGLTEQGGHVQGVPDVRSPEDLLHKLQLLQKDAVDQNHRLAQAAAQNNGLNGEPLRQRRQHIRLVSQVFIDGPL